MWKVLPLLALLCSTAHGQDNVLYPASKPSSKSPPSKYKPSPAIVIEFAPVPVAPPPWNWKAERAAAESAANEWGRAAVERGRAAGSPAALPSSTVVPTWKSQIVARLEEHKRYPEEARSRREQGVAQVFFSIDRQGRVLESRVVRSSGANALDEEALALLKRAEPFPPPPQELAGDHVDLTIPIRFNFTPPASSASTPQPSSPAPTADRPFFLTIKSDRSLTLGNDPVARDALVGLLNTASGGAKARTIFLRADKRLPYGEVMNVMNLLRAAGYTKVALVSE
jgi:TonB family protein